MALTTTARIELFRPIGSATAKAAQCQAAAEAWVTGQLGFDPNALSRTEITTGDGSRVLRVTAWPVTAVTALTVDGAAWSVLAQSGTYDGSQQAIIDRSGKWIEALGLYVFPVGTIISNTYTAGYATIPDDLQQVAVMATWLALEESNRLGMTGKSIGPEQVNSLARNSKDYEFMHDTIQRYRRLW
ncbi:MAG: hypothetical protein PHU75_03840 [Candidatus Nanopelagicales bacterium]|nr:hypothetical protein [Candidatus Nanopelagicales bacterium]